MLRPKLNVISGPREGTVFELTGDTFEIGRSSSTQLQIRQTSVSRHHCVIEREGGSWRLKDLGSRHGTFVNGEPASERDLEHRDFINVGGSVVLFLLREDRASDEASSAFVFDDSEYPAESTVQIPAGDTQKQWVEKLEAAFRPGARSERRLRALLEISTVLPSIHRVEPLAERFQELLLDVVPGDRCALWLIDEGGGEFRRVHPAGQPVSLSRHTADRVLREQQTLFCNDVQASEDFRTVDDLPGERIRSLVCAPLLIADRSLGVLYVETRNPRKRFTDGDLQLIDATAAIAALAFANARRIESLEAENRRLRERPLNHGMVSCSSAMEKVFERLARVAETDSTVLILGESGTGKGLAARAIHDSSSRSGGPFVALNCANFTRDLLENELFGHEKGAFTGAVERKPGHFEAADGGTIFLDEVAELPPDLQAKLLRILEERQFQRVGGTRLVEVDVRIIAATNRDLEQAIAEGAFRQDLYYRLCVIPVPIPPLKERREDIPLLAHHFAVKSARRAGRSVCGISPEAIELLVAYPWPGNVRELANVIEQAVVLGQGGEWILPSDLPNEFLDQEPSSRPASGYHEAVKAARRKIILEALEAAHGSVAGAARKLDLQRNYLHRLITDLDLKDELERIRERYRQE